MPKIKAKRIRVKDKTGVWKDVRGFSGPPGESPVIGENENWYIGNKDTGVRAKGKSGVHVGGDTPPEGTKVWVNPNGERTKIPKVDETLAKPGYAADAAKVGEKINQLSGEIVNKADKAYIVGVFEELKALIEAGNTAGAIAVLDAAILDMDILA